MKSLALISLLITFIFASCNKKVDQPRVFIFTDINIDSGDPDDRQSLVHLLWYADELEIEGIVPDRWNAQGLEASELALEAYSKDFQLFELGEKSFTDPRVIKNKLALNREDAIRKFHAAASIDSNPLYVLVWGNMELFGEALRQKPELAQNIRLITIGTNLMMEEYRQYIPEGWEVMEKPCEQYNWNGGGRNQIFNDPRFNNMWWLEINWTYEGMFSGNEPEEIYQNLSQYGALGQHMIDVTINEPWARYFRVGDTPSVLYVIDTSNDLNDPMHGSWAGTFLKPFPQQRPNYYTDHNGPVEWDYANPCNTWGNHVAMRDYAKNTLEDVRPAMYDALLEKLDEVYGGKSN